MNDSVSFTEGEPTAFYREFFTNLWSGVKPEGMPSSLHLLTLLIISLNVQLVQMLSLGLSLLPTWSV